MSRVVTTVSIEPHLKVLAKLKNVNISTVVNSALKQLLEADNEVPLEIQLERAKVILQQKEEEYQEALTAVKTIESTIGVQKEQEWQQELEETKMLARADQLHGGYDR